MDINDKNNKNINIINMNNFNNINQFNDPKYTKKNSDQVQSILFNMNYIPNHNNSYFKLPLKIYDFYIKQMHLTYLKSPRLVMIDLIEFDNLNSRNYYI